MAPSAPPPPAPADVDEEPLHVDTGDQMKVKQVLDESVVKAIVDLGFDENFFWDNVKLGLMVVACAFAMVAQFYPMPFPESRPLLGVCCVSYFLASTVIQVIVSYVEQDAILTTQPHELAAQGLRVRTQFPRFQDEYTVILEAAGQKDPPTVTEKFSIGKVFDEEGNFWEEGLARYVETALQRFRKGQWDKEEEPKAAAGGGKKGKGEGKKTK